MLLFTKVEGNSAFRVPLLQLNQAIHISGHMAASYNTIHIYLYQYI